MRQIVRAMAIAAIFGLSAAPVQAADLGIITAPYTPMDGAPCIFQDWGPVISLPWPSVWLGHFSGGRFIDTPYGRTLDWHDEKLCFPSKPSCDRWIRANRQEFHRPEGHWTCLPIR